MKKIIILITSLFLLFSLIISLPHLFELIYLNNKTDNNLYKLCEISGFLKNDKLILKYYPQIIFDMEKGETLTNSEKDTLLFNYLDAAVNIDEYVEQKRILKKSFGEFSGIESAITGSVGFVYSFYEKTNDEKKCYELFEVLLDVSSNKDYEFKNGIYTKYIEFLINNNEFDLLVKIRDERKQFLINNGVDMWSDQSD